MPRLESQLRTHRDQEGAEAVQIVLRAVFDTRVDVRLGPGVKMRADSSERKVAIRAGHLLLESRILRELDAALQLLGAGLWIRHVFRAGDRRPRVRRGLRVAGSVGELEPPAAPVGGALEVSCIPVQVRPQAVGPDPVSIRCLVPEHVHGPGCGRLGLFPAADGPQQPRHRAQHVSLGGRIAAAAVTVLRLAEQSDRFGEVPDEGAFVGATSEEHRPLFRWEAAGEPECSCILGRRLTMRPDRGRTHGSLRCEAQHRLLVAGSLGVVREPGDVRGPRGGARKCGESLAVETPSQVRRQRLFDGYAGELVAECDRPRPRDEHSGRQALLEAAGGVTREIVEEPQLHVQRRDGHRVHHRLGRCAEASHAGEHRVAHRGGDLILAGRQHLRDEEGIASRRPEELLRIEAMRLGERGDAHGGKRRDTHTADGLYPGELSEHEPERVLAIELVVAVAREDECARGVEAPCEEPHDVERGLVGPVQIFEDHDGRGSARELVDQRRGDVVGTSGGVDDLLELALRLFRDILQRAERARCEQGVAGAPQHSRGVSPLAAEVAQERGLARPGLATDEPQLAASYSARGRESVVERGDLTGTLEQAARVDVRSGFALGHVAGAARPRPSMFPSAPRWSKR